MTVLVVMGVSGSGKTTVAELLAKQLGWAFQEGDALHPAANVAKMSSGTPLTDADRQPWLEAVARLIDAWRGRGENGVVTCSALKHAYRDILLQGRPDVRIVYLQAERALLEDRMAKRRGHFMPAKLLDSQLATLEEPGADEHPIVVHVGGTPESIVADVVRKLG